MSTVYAVERTEFEVGQPPYTEVQAGRYASIEEVDDFLDIVQYDASRDGSQSVVRGHNTLIVTTPAGFTSVRRAIEVPA
jgi:hypothetical protein